MTIDDAVELMIKSSDMNPYTGKLSEKDNIIASIDLAKLCLDFAKNGNTDEAMNLDVDDWKLVIKELEKKL
jgi:hypothetical protein